MCNAKMQYNKRKETCVVFPLKKALNTLNIWSTQNNKELKQLKQDFPDKIFGILIETKETCITGNCFPEC